LLEYREIPVGESLSSRKRQTHDFNTVARRMHINKTISPVSSAGSIHLKESCSATVLSYP